MENAGPSDGPASLGRKFRGSIFVCALDPTINEFVREKFVRDERFVDGNVFSQGKILEFWADRKASDHGRVAALLLPTLFYRNQAGAFGIVVVFPFRHCGGDGILRCVVVG